MLIVVRLFSGAMQSNASVANAYVADITPPERARQALRPARRDVRPRLHPRPGDRRPARRDRPAPAVLRRRRAGAAQPALRLVRAARVAAARAAPAVLAGARRQPGRRAAELGRLERRRHRWSRWSPAPRWRSSSSTRAGCSTRPSSSAGARSENGWSLFAVGVHVGAGAGRAARPAAEALLAAAAGDRRPGLVDARLPRLGRGDARAG